MKHAAISAELYTQLSLRIKNADSKAELELLRDEVFDHNKFKRIMNRPLEPGRQVRWLLDELQRKEIATQWRNAIYRKHQEEGGRPGDL